MLPSNPSLPTERLINPPLTDLTIKEMHLSYHSAHLCSHANRPNGIAFGIQATGDGIASKKRSHRSVRILTGGVETRKAAGRTLTLGQTCIDKAMAFEIDQSRWDDRRWRQGNCSLG